MPTPTDDPLYSGELRKSADQTLAAMLRTLLVVLPVLIAAAAFGEVTPGGLAVLCAALAFVLALYFVQRRGHFLFCTHALVFGFIAFSLASIGFTGSVRGPGSVALVAAIAFGGLFLGRPALVIAATLSVCSLGTLIYAENAGWLPAPNYRLTATHWVIYSGVVAAVALVLSYMRSLLLDLVRQQRNELVQRQEAEAGRQQSEAKYAAVFRSTPDPIAIARERDAVQIEVNEAWLRLTGIPREQAVGKSALELGLWADPAQRGMVLAQLDARGAVDNFPVRLRIAGGLMIDALLSGVRITLDGEPCILWSCRDVTQLQRAEAAKHQALQKFTTLFETNPVGIVLTRPRDQRILEINDAALALLGVTREEALAKSSLQVIRLPDGAARSEARRRVLAGERVVDLPMRLEHPSGALLDTLASAAPIVIEGESLVMITLRDVTEQRLTHDALRASEHRYRSLFQAAMDCILVISPAGEILDINDYGCRTLGYARDELVNGSFGRILDESKFARLLPRPPQVKSERRSLRAEQEVRAKDGSLRAVEFTAGTLPDGNILVVARDITERHRQEKLLENIAKSVSSQTGVEFFRSLVVALCRELPADMAFIGEAVGDGDRVRTIACCSDGVLAENFEYPLHGSPCILAMERRGTVIHPENVAEQFPEDVALARRGIAGYAGTSLFDTSGKALGILVALTRKPIERKEFFVSMLEIFAARAAAEIERARADATVRELNVSLERRVRERTSELEAANRDLDSFGYTVSHDLRAPLGALNGFAYLLRTNEADRLSADGAHLLRQLEGNATRMIDLVEGLLEFSRLGRKSVTRSAVSMSTLVDEVVEELRIAHRDRRVEFRVGSLPQTYGDPVLLRQVWKNLVGNAVKYSRARDPAVVEIGFDAAAREYFVRDNGAGFDMQYAGKLFGVFERLHGESEFQGTGVGLAIVQRIVRRHGGEVRGEGQPDRGATFRFSVPAG